MTDLNETVIMPREDFLELQAATYDPNSTTLATRAASTAQTALVFGSMAGAVVAGSWGWAKAMDWLEERNFQRKTGRRVSTVTDIPKKS